jgi:hypothetical protein
VSAFTFVLPLLGTPIALLVLATRSRGELDTKAPAEALPPPCLTVADVRRLIDRLSPCEALLSGTPEEKSATIAMLSRGRDPTSVTLLRRAVTGPDPDVAVEAALALEDMGAALEALAAAAHEELAGDPGLRARAR